MASGVNVRRAPLQDDVAVLGLPEGRERLPRAHRLRPDLALGSRKVVPPTQSAARLARAAAAPVTAWRCAREVLKLLLSFWLALTGALSSAESAKDAKGSQGNPEGWVRYANGVHRYELWHPPDWEPDDRLDRSLRAFRVPGSFGRTRDFWVMHTPAHQNLSLKQVFERWKPNLTQAEGARYLLHLVRERRLGPNRALEIPMAGTRAYQSALWLLEAGGQNYAILAEITSGEATVRKILASMRTHPEVAPP